jgi:hypothetical protein
MLGAFLADVLFVQPTRGNDAMYDYSLHNIASRPAKAGDELVTTDFTNAFTRGFSAVGKPNVAVSLLPGTELAFREDARCDHLLGNLFPWLRLGKLGDKVARFRQISVDHPNVYHDALEFANGKIVFVITLRPGQRLTVLQLPVRMHSRSADRKHTVSNPPR